MSFSEIVYWIRIILFVISIYSIIVNFLRPSFFRLFKGYKFRKLKNKNIKTNANYSEKKYFIHPWLFFHSFLTLIVLIHDGGIFSTI